MKATLDLHSFEGFRTECGGAPPGVATFTQGKDKWDDQVILELPGEAWIEMGRPARVEVEVTVL